MHIDIENRFFDVTTAETRQTVFAVKYEGESVILP